MNNTQDFGERVKKFYYYRALLCEKLINREVTVNGLHTEMPPMDYDPFKNFSVDAYVIGCAAIDGLASIWESLNQSQSSDNQKRFTNFLIHLDTRNQMERICTPFLVFFLEKQGIEEPFVNKVRAKWLNNQGEHESHRVYTDPTFADTKTIHESHRVYTDPTFADIKRIYEECKDQPVSNNLHIKDIEKIRLFQYAALIYKFYRCSFIHEFKASKFVTLSNKGNEISIRDVIRPQLDIGVGVLTESIRRGADEVFRLIVNKQCTDIPYSSNDEIKLKVRSPR